VFSFFKCFELLKLKRNHKGEKNIVGLSYYLEDKRSIWVTIFLAYETPLTTICLLNNIASLVTGLREPSGTLLPPVDYCMSCLLVAPASMVSTQGQKIEGGAVSYIHNIHEIYSGVYI
jgi:hypothetical protein